MKAQHLKPYYDTVIIGSGPVGLGAAFKLIENKKNIYINTLKLYFVVNFAKEKLI